MKYFLGNEVAYPNQGIFISHQQYITDLLVEIGCRLVSTPMDLNHKLYKAKERLALYKKMYQRLVGKLIYLAHTQPDIPHSVSIINHFMHELKESHL